MSYLLARALAQQQDAAQMQAARDQQQVTFDAMRRSSGQPFGRTHAQNALVAAQGDKADSYAKAALGIGGLGTQDQMRLLFARRLAGLPAPMSRKDFAIQSGIQPEDTQ